VDHSRRLAPPLHPHQSSAQARQQGPAAASVPQQLLVPVPELQLELGQEQQQQQELRQA
jgi:hypothetical protein